jgi:hypothetical protein
MGSGKIILLGALLGLLLFGAAGAGAASTYTDPQGDALGGAADVTQIDVSNDVDGNITFDVTLPNRPALGAGDFLLVLLDTDNNASTGRQGLEFAIAVDPSGPGLLRASASGFSPTASSTLTSSNGGKSVRINRSELGNTTVFTFFVLTGLESDDNAGDDAPNTGAYLYTLQLRPVLDSLAARFAPAKPKAGKAFRVASTSLRLEDGTDVKADSITCVAKLNGKRLKGRCSWRIPANARGKRLVVTITARYRAATATFLPWRFRVG